MIRTLRTSYTAPWGILGLILLTSLILMVNVSNQESAIMDELAHIPAGYGYVKYLDYRLNPEHPPLVKALAAFPLLFGNFNFPDQSSAWQKDVNGQWEAGAKFLYESGNDADKIIQWARFGPMLITLLLIIFIYIWAKELMGRWWALLPAFLFGLSPTVIEHGHFVTTDLGAAFGIFIAIYYLAKYLLSHSGKHLFYAGLAFGLAQLLKFSSVLLIPLFVFLFLVFYFWKTDTGLRGASFPILFLGYIKALWSSVWRLIVIFGIGYLLVYAVYFVFTINYPIEKQVSDTEYTLTSFAGGPDKTFESCELGREIPFGRRMRCLADVNIAMAKNPALRPLGEYLLGVLMVIQRSAGGNTAYFLGEVSASGWWYYFPVVFALKEPIPSLLLLFIALALALSNIAKRIKHGKICHGFSDYLGTNFAEFSMISFVTLYWTYSIKSPLNIGVRHILPTIPFIYILSVGMFKKWIGGRFALAESFCQNTVKVLSNLLRFSFKGALIAVLIVWFAAETLFTYPYYLSYFNEFAGGTENGYKYVTDSNYDWGQDLKRLKDFLETWNVKHETKIDKIAVDYFGGGSPRYYLGNKTVEWNSSKGDPREKGINWLAISVNSLEGAIGKLHLGQKRDIQDEYSWLQNPEQPFARAGTSIFIYKL